MTTTGPVANATNLPCMICKSGMDDYFQKDFAGLAGLNLVDYTRCPLCDFVQAETIYRMTDAQWTELNVTGHGRYQGSEENDDDPRWLERLEDQRDVLALLKETGALPAGDRWLDWGAGDGKLSALLAQAGVPIRPYDAYMKHEGYVTDAELAPGGFDLVISTSVFEHVRELETLDAMESLVWDRGVFAIHTLVREVAPPDPTWFYYAPLHISFFGNESMRRLFARWGYAGCVYHVRSRLWFWFKDPATDVFAIAERGNALAGETLFYAANEFVAYWK